MKTILVTSFNPFILRNILSGQALDVLRRNPETRMIVIVPDYKADFFQSEIGDDNVIIEGVESGRVSRQDVIFRFLNGSLADIRTLLIHKWVQLKNKKNYLRFLASYLLMRVFSHLPGFRNLIRFCDYLTISKDRFTGVFEKYQPDLVFVTDIFHDDDVHLLAEARSRKIKTVGMIRSWDNFTTKGSPRSRPDRLIVHNEVIKQEAICYGDFSNDRIFVNGPPQYDDYFRGQRMSRADFFRRIGLDPARKLILFSPFGQRFTDVDWQIMNILKEFIDQNKIPSSQVLIRFTPNDDVSLGKFIPDKKFYIDKPGHQFRPGIFRDQELTVKDMNWLADCVYYADIIVAGGASICVDAAIFGKPSILIHFDGYEERPYWQSVRRFDKYSHATDLIKMGALRSAKSREQLLDQLNDHLKDFDLGKAAREKMIIRQCGKLDGLAGKRLGEYLIACLPKI